ncbi:MAG: hypothetical protein ACLKAN_11275 [Alkaliphilus sp.]
MNIEVFDEFFNTKFSPSREFSKAEAYFFIKMHGIASINFLAQKFDWSRIKTKNFISEVEEMERKLIKKDMLINMSKDNEKDMLINMSKNKQKDKQKDIYKEENISVSSYSADMLINMSKNNEKDMLINMSKNNKKDIKINMNKNNQKNTAQQKDKDKDKDKELKSILAIMNM